MTPRRETAVTPSAPERFTAVIALCGIVASCNQPDNSGIEAEPEPNGDVGHSQPDAPADDSTDTGDEGGSQDDELHDATVDSDVSTGLDTHDSASDDPAEHDVAPSDTIDIPDDSDTVDDADGDTPVGCDVDEGCIDARTGESAAPCATDFACIAPLTCGPRGYCVGAAHAVTFSPVGVAPLAVAWSDDWTLAPPREDLTYSPGFAFLADPDGTALLFTARSPLPRTACILKSVAGGPWEASPLCDLPLVNTTAVAAIPATRSRPARHIIAGLGQLLVVDVAPDATVNLFDSLSPDDRRRACLPLSLAVDDLNLDGILDITLECTSPAQTGGRDAANMLWIGREDGTFELVTDREPYDAIARWGRRLATAVADFNNDGLLDRLLIQDSFSLPDSRNTTAERGYWVRTCAPTETCVVEATPITTGSDAWGSFMGASSLWVETLGMRVFVTDAGPNRLLDPDDSGATDAAERVGLAEGLYEGDDFVAFLFAWSAVVEDFDRDGREDVVLTQGVFDSARAIAGTAAPHPDLLFLQREDGTFERHEEPSLVHPDGFQLSRGAVAVDLDRDGLLEIFIARWQRAPLLLEELDTGGPRRCSVQMLPSIVPAAGYGLSSAPFVDGPWTVERMAGQSAIQPPNEFVSTLRAGFARFPSGAVMPFDCRDGAGPEVLVEPAWISASFDDGALRLAIDPALWPEPITTVVAALDGPRPASTVELAPSDLDTYVASIENNPGRVMIRINARWVGVWLTVEDAAP